jgi:hypothetical protein
MFVFTDTQILVLVEAHDEVDLIHNIVVFIAIKPTRSYFMVSVVSDVKGLVNGYCLCKLHARLLASRTIRNLR